MIHNRVRLIAYSNNSLLVMHHTNKDYYYFPGGHIEEGESMKTALVRELDEELEMKIEVENLRLMYLTEFVNEGAHGIEYIFSYELDEIDKYVGKANPEHPSQIANILNINNIPDNLYPKYLKDNLVKDLEAKGFFFIGQIE